MKEIEYKCVIFFSLSIPINIGFLYYVMRIFGQLGQDRTEQASD